MKRPLAGRSLLLALLALAWTAPGLDAQMSVSLDASSESPVPVGTVVTFTANVSDATDGTLWYRFRVRRIDSDFRMLKDYGPDGTLDWTPQNHDGVYEIEVSVRNRDTGETVVGSRWFEMQSNVTGNQPAITPTSHPLVFRYNAPPCGPEGRLSVQFRSPGGIPQTTPSHPCQADRSTNIYVAGLQPNTEYSVHHTIDTGRSQVDGPTLTLTTGDLPLDLAWQSVLQPPRAASAQGILLQATLFTNPLATDLNGNVVWYFPGNLSFLTRPEPGGYFFGIIQDPAGDTSRQILREFDLTGMTVLETNAARVNEQLVALGKPPISAFHHEARRLPDGKVLVLGSVEQILTDVQGPGPVDVLGDMIIVMSPDLEVLWTWNTFDHLDPTRAGTLNDVCLPGVCPPLYLAPNAMDWTHANSVALTPDGHLLLSSRSQDWVIKIDYDHGNGSGDIIWRLGKDGDFQIDSDDPNPWFSHQHDAHFVNGNASLLILLDNGNGRNNEDPTALSRGQVFQLDEQKGVAKLILNANLGQYAFALGSAQKLANGNYHFLTGFLNDATSISLEVDPTGEPVYALQAGAPAYRTFRMRDLYSPE